MDEELELDNVYRVLEEYRRDFEAMYKRDLERDGRVASGQLINNLSTEIDSMGTTITVFLNVADYFKYVEEGRGSGKRPPKEAILKWIKDKHIVPREINGKLPTENQLAFLIARKIGYEGYQGSHTLQHTIEDLNDLYMRKLQSALEADFGVYEIKVLDKINKMVKIY